MIGQSAIAKGLSHSSGRHEPSLVMKDINSLTHSCMHSFASFAIFAFSGRAVFIIRATGAKFLILASECSCFPAFEARGASGDDEEEAWDMMECITVVVQQDIYRAFALGTPRLAVEHKADAIPLATTFNLRRRIFEKGE